MKVCKIRLGEHLSGWVRWKCPCLYQGVVRLNDLVWFISMFLFPFSNLDWVKFSFMQIASMKSKNHLNPSYDLLSDLK